MAYQVGDVVPGLGTVEAVTLDAVDIRRAARCLIRLPASSVADASRHAVEQRARNGVPTGHVNSAAGKNS